MIPRPAKIGDLVWHIHHDVLVEPLTEPIEARAEYIRAHKPEHERATRLRLMKPVRGSLPEVAKARAKRDKADAEWAKAVAERDKADAELAKARAAWDKANAEWYKTYTEWDKARVEWDKADAECDKVCFLPSVLKLHAKECPNCPWDGRTIFP